MVNQDLPAAVELVVIFRLTSLPQKVLAAGYG